MQALRPPEAKMGRSSDYSQEVADLICQRMATGESLRSICRDDGMPAESTVRLWAVDDREGFAAQYARARDAQMDALSEDLLDISDGDGDPVTLKAVPAGATLLIACKKIMSTNSTATNMVALF